MAVVTGADEVAATSRVAALCLPPPGSAGDCVLILLRLNLRSPARGGGSWLQD